MYIIIIPYRDRAKHLSYFLNTATKIFDETLKDYQIVVVEQSGRKPFNRGILINIGIMLSDCKKDSNIFFTHDVDITPLIHTVEKYYSGDIKTNTIMGIYTSECDTLGGIIKFKKSTFININGFPNNYWGWGVEDKALQNRAELMEVEITKNIRNADDNIETHFKIFKDCHNTVIHNSSKLHHWQDYDIWERLNRVQKLKVVHKNGVRNLKYKFSVLTDKTYKKLRHIFVKV